MSRYTKETGDTTDNKDTTPTAATRKASSTTTAASATTTSSSASATSGGGTGLSDYTAQRLAELRARRAEREQEYKELKSSASSAGITSATTNGTSADTKITTSSSASAIRNTSAVAPTAAVEPSGSFRTRRTEISATTTSPTTNGSTNGDSKDYTKDYSKEYTKDYISKLTAEHRGGSNLSRTSSRSTADQDDDEVIGFASLPEQVHRKALKRGFDFTLMVVGETGLGKSTLVQSLFLNNELYDDRELCNVQDRIAKTVSIEQKFMEIEERGVKLRLTIVDTPGFNDAVNGDGSWKLIETYIERQFEQYLNDESGLSRKNIKDNRVHCCLYFVSPFGHGLRQMDINFMRRMHDKVNIVPVIAKADTLTAAEIKRLKDKILDEIDEHNINIYEFPECDSDEDEDFLQQDRELKAAIPFAVIGSDTIVEMNGKKIRGRQYPWGIVEVDNPDHCDFLKLRQMLISTHMQDLKDVTRDVHYENYRAKHIAEQMTKAAQKERNKLDVQSNNQYEEIPTATKRYSKLKRDSSPNFENIMQTDQLLKQKDEEIRKMQEMLMKMQAQLQQTGSGKGQMNGQLNSGLKKL